MMHHITQVDHFYTTFEDLSGEGVSYGLIG